jgi:hypothetical protein
MKTIILHPFIARQVFLYPLLFGAMVGFAPMIQAEITNYYPFNRHIRPVAIEAASPLSAVSIRRGAQELTGIVGPFPVITNTVECVLQTGLAWQQPDPLSAWVAATGSQTRGVISTNQIQNEVGWMSGIRTNSDRWGAFHWFLQNRIVFQTPTQTVWYSPQGVSNEIVRVLVGSLGDFEPGEICDSQSPAPPPLLPHTCLTTQIFFRADFNAYLRLVETRWVLPHVQDADTDCIPDFADGFNIDGIAGNSDDKTPGDFFPALNILLPPIEDPVTFLFRIVYTASDPLDVILPTPGTDLQPGPGALRLWLKSAQALRNGLPFTLGGDYLPPGTYSAQELGLTPDSFEWTIYLEMIRSGVGDSIRIDWSTDGGTRWRSMERINLCMIKMDMVPDWNHDRVIDERDRTRLSTNDPYCFWINDDSDVGFEGRHIPGSPGWLDRQDWKNGSVDGESDLIDFFPVWLDLSSALKSMPPADGFQYKLKQADAAVKIVYTDLTKGEAGNYQIASNTACGANFNASSFSASTLSIPASGLILSTSFLNKIRDDTNKGVLLVEGAGITAAPLELEVTKNGQTVFHTEMPLRLDDVQKMYRHLNLRGDNNGRPTETNNPSNYPDSLCINTDVVMLPGVNVDGESARAWHAEMFKRLYWAGSQARFHGITFRSDDGNDDEYQRNVVNAFQTASNLSAYVMGLPGRKIVIAHSMGNIVVCSAIQDWAMPIDKYFMLNAAVATEALNDAEFNDSTNSNVMLRPDWKTYAPRTWASKWHELFQAYSNDARSQLTWKMRFSIVGNMGQNIINIYSVDDQCLDIYSEGIGFWTGADLDIAWSGITLTVDHYVWHKQESFKGRDWLGIITIGATDYAGWGFRNTLGVKTYSAEAANNAPDTLLRSDCVFRPEPPGMFSAVISKELQNEILAKGIPALSYPVGHNNLSLLNPVQNINLADADHRPNGWPKNHPELGRKWLHSDIKDMAYFYVYKGFTDFVTLGGLNP